MIVTLGLYRNRSVERIKGNQAAFDNSQRNNLRSCLWILLSGRSVLSSLPSRRAGFLPSYIAFLRRHVVPLGNLYFPILSQEICQLVKAPEPHGLGPHNFNSPGRSNDKPTDPRTAQTPQALRVSGLLAYQRKRSYRFYDLTPRISYLVAFAVHPEISPLGPLWP